jgi:hypothetical protein
VKSYLGIADILSENMAVGYFRLIEFVAKGKKKLWPGLRESIFSWQIYIGNASL